MRKSKMRLRDVLEDFYLDFAPDLARNSVLKLRHHLNSWEGLTDDPPIRKITMDVIVGYRNASLALEYSPITIEKRVNTVMQLLTHAHRLDLLKKVPFVGRRLKQRVRIKYVPTLEAISAVYSNTHVATWPNTHVPPCVFWQVWLVTAFFTGLRSCDLIEKLKWKNISEKQIDMQAEKTGKLQFLPMTPVLLQHLKAIRGHHGERVFPIIYNGKLIRRELRRMSKAANVDPVLTPHAIRQRAGTEFERARHGAGKTLLGLDPASVADFYILPEHVEVAAEKVRFPTAFTVGPDTQIDPIEYQPKMYEPVQPPDPDDWKFDGCRFCFRGQWFPLRAERMRVLKALAQAGRALTAEELGEVADICPEGKNIALLRRRAVAGTCRLRIALRKLFGLPSSWDPVLCTGRGSDLSWSIALPPNFVPPQLDASARVDLAEVSCLSPTKMKTARLSAGLKQIELAAQIGVSDRTVSQWERGQRPLYLSHAEKIRNVLGSHLEE